LTISSVEIKLNDQIIYTGSVVPTVNELVISRKLFNSDLPYQELTARVTDSRGATGTYKTIFDWQPM